MHSKISHTKRRRTTKQSSFLWRSKHYLLVVVFSIATAIVGSIFIWQSFAVVPISASDLNGDGVVNLTDLSILLSNYGTNKTAGDINGDGVVNLTDLSILLSNYGKQVSPSPTPPAPPVTPPTPTPAPTPTPTGASAAKPCVSSAAPVQWKHVILLMFENEVASSVIGASEAPYITSLATKCGTAQGWKDGNIRVDGTTDGNYNSKPSYATLTSGVSPSVSHILTDNYGDTTSVDNIFNRLNLLGKDTKSYQSGPGGGCDSSNFEGAYHDAMRYYQNLGGQSSSPTTYCNTHDVPLSSLMADINAGKLPAFSLLLPTNNQNMHNNSVASGDAYAKTIIDPILDSAQYKSGDTAIFFLWDEESPIPNVLMAPSIVPGTKPTAPVGGNPITHFTFTRTTQEMLGVSPLLGSSGQAPSLINFFDGH